MKLNPSALAMVAAIFTAAAIFIVGIANLIWTGYGFPFLEMMASIYPGYNASGAIGDLMVGTLYGLVDGLVCGWLFGWLYNRFATTRAGTQNAQQSIEP